MRYMINDAPVGGWIDTETGTSFTDSDPESAVYKEFVAWLAEGNIPDEPNVVVEPETVTVGEHVDQDARIQLAADLQSYFDNPAPTHEFTVATLKTLIRMVLN